ncbi:MAG TPA: RcnB family protein [Dyella sp.]|uniref:RcnB family protein n=1 Tax=Dyella sp. TaxID=1869338 RepID=UPI002F92C1E6
MKKSLLALAVGAVLVASAVSASAQDWHDHDHDHDHGHDHDRTVVIEHDRGRHEGWYHKGGYVPAEYRDRRYVVEDWRSYRLREPPRGYHWVRSDNGDFLLVAVATGVITDLILNSH